MRRRNFIVAALAMSLVAFGVAAYRPGDPRNAIPQDNHVYHVRDGVILGVRMGDGWQRADAALRRFPGVGDPLWETGHYVTEGGAGVKLGHIPVLEGEARVAYSDNSWRRGVITLYLRDGRVTEVAYSYVGPFFIDL